MNKNVIFLSLLIVQLVMVASAHGRAKAAKSYDKMVAESDVVCIIEPIESGPVGDNYVGHMYGFSPKDFVATNTRFRIHAFLKGGELEAKEITVLHFSYSKDVGGRANGACFINFLTGPLQYQKRALKDEKPVGGVTCFREPPIWLAFLKKRKDGRFEPITDPYDSADSFREIHRSSFYTGS